MTKYFLLKMADEWYNHILELVAQGRDLATYSLKLIEPAVEDIIKNKSESIEDIERTLDYLLEIIPFGFGEKEFKKLNNYYKTFMPDNAKVYNKFLKEDYSNK